MRQAGAIAGVVLAVALAFAGIAVATPGYDWPGMKGTCRRGNAVAGYQN